MDLLDETRSIPASYSRFTAFSSLPGVRLWLLSIFLTIFLVSISTGPSSLPYCPIQILLVPQTGQHPTVYLAFYISALCSVGY